MKKCVAERRSVEEWLGLTCFLGLRSFSIGAENPFLNHLINNNVNTTKRRVNTCICIQV